MRKWFALMIGLGVILGVFSREIALMAEVYLGKPQTHVIQKGESLSKLALHYYGNADYWRELALINMAPDPDLIWVGEEILIPDKAAVEQIHRAKTLSVVKNLVIKQELALNESPRGEPPALTQKAPAEETPSEVTVRESEPPASPFQTVPRPPAESEASDFYWVWWVAALLIIGGVVGMYWLRRRQTTPEAVPAPGNNAPADQFRAAAAARQARAKSWDTARNPAVIRQPAQREPANGADRKETDRERRREPASLEQ